MDALDLNRARPEDADGLAALGRETFMDTFVHGFGIAYPEEDLAPFLEANFSPAAFARIIADADLAVWLLRRDGEAVAYATAGRVALPHPDADPARDGELKRLYIRRDLQGAGLAPRMMEAALAWLDPAGGRRLWLGVWSGNLRAQRFYARYGFEKAGEYEYPVGRTRDREFILRRG